MIQKIQSTLREISNIDDLEITQSIFIDTGYVTIPIKDTGYFLKVKKGCSYKVLHNITILLEIIINHIIVGYDDNLSLALAKKDIKNILELSQNLYSTNLQEEEVFSFLDGKMSYALVKNGIVISNIGLDDYSIKTSIMKLDKCVEFAVPIRNGELFAFRTTNFNVIILADTPIDDLIKTTIKLQLIIVNEIYLNQRSREMLEKINSELEEIVSLKTNEVIDKNKQLEKDKMELDNLNHELMEANQKLEIASRTDPLTGLWNRRHFKDKFNMTMQDSLKDMKPYALLLGDIDYFKSVNDNYGHDFGDQTLVRIADLFKHSMRSNDTVSRHGGEEFIILLPETDLQGMCYVAEKLREQISAESFDHPSGNVHLTISFGGCVFKGIHKLSECIGIVDKYMYKAKLSGRNKVMCCEKVIGFTGS
jgi:diguanylate cyclase (GGDEF) domain